jgi:hypothetical protein
MTFHADETVTIVTTEKVTRTAYDADPSVASEFCQSGGDKLVGADAVECVEKETVPISNYANGNADGQGMRLHIERLENRELMVTVPLNDIFERADGSNMTFQDETERDMARMMLAGHSISMKISAKEVLHTNARISEDAETAELILPLTDIIFAPETLPRQFEARLRY